MINLSTSDTPTPEALSSKILQDISASDCTGVFVHFHGGLVGEQEGELVGHKLAGAMSGSNVCIVNVVWRTGVRETVADIRSRFTVLNAFDVLLRLSELSVGRWLAAERGGRGAISAATPDQSRRLCETADLEAPGRLHQLVQPIAADIDGFDAAYADLGPSLAEEDFEREFPTMKTSVLREELGSLTSSPLSGVAAPSRGAFTLALALAAVRTARRVLGRAIHATDHGWRATITEEVLREMGAAFVIGELWNNMKVRADELFARPEGAGRVLIEALRMVQKARPGLHVHVCGHSAGTIAQCHMVAALGREGLQDSYFYMLAPACSLELFRTRVLQGPGPRRPLYLFVLKDELECRDAVLSPGYPRSLLYLVSGLLEFDTLTLTPSSLLGLERCLRIDGSGSGGSSVASAFGNNGWVLVRSPSDPGSAVACGATTHGGFDDDDATLATIGARIREAAYGRR